MAANATPKRYGFDASRRLRRKAQFERLLKHGLRRTLGGFRFYVEPRSGGPPRLGILISRRHAAKATDRNYIKRCIREAFRLCQAELGAVDLLVRPPYGQRPAPDMIKRLSALLERIAK